MRRLFAGWLVFACIAVGQERWDFNPRPDDFKADALLDLRYLNEGVAGESGFVRVNEQGDFVLGNGEPVRFWAVNSEVLRTLPFAPRPLWRQSAPSLERHARFLAKRGVNMVRLHAFINPKRATQQITDIDTAERDWIWRCVAAFKKEGIYVTISPYWSNNFRIFPEWQIPDAPESHALLFFNAKIQEAYKAWMKALYAETNPYTGIPLAEDPAVAIIQLQNEDSLLFYTIDRLRGEQRREFGQRYHRWLVAKYGDIEGARTAWNFDRLANDDPANGFMDFHILWEMTQRRTGGRARRLADQLEFWTTVMREFNSGMVQYLREELGCRQLVNAGNWKTGDFVRLEDIERYSYTSADVLATNRYFTGVHLGPNRSWAIMANDQFTSPSILEDPRAFPLNLKQVRGYPMMVTESIWVPPAGYQAEAPFLIAAYQSLTGIDAYYWFSTGDDEYSPPQSANGYLNGSLQKWTFAHPDVLGTFPAAALLYRRGYLKQGEPVVVEHRALGDFWNRRQPVISESPSYDPVRDAGDIAPESSVQSGTDPGAFLVGPVLLVPGSDPAETQVADLKESITQAGGIRANTGEIVLDPAKRQCRIDAPKAQGIAAFFQKDEVHEFTDVTLKAAHEYGTVLVVPLDDLPIAESARLLVQVGTQSRSNGWVERDAELTVDNKPVRGKQVESVGRGPWQVVAADLQVEIRNASLTRARALDSNGNATEEVAVEKTETGLKFQFPVGTLYVVVE